MASRFQRRYNFCKFATWDWGLLNAFAGGDGLLLDGQTREENCVDYALGRVGGSAPLVNMVVDQKGPSTTLVNNNNGRFATAGTAPVQVMPNVGIQQRGSMVRPPQPAPSSGAGNPDNKVMSEVAIVAIVAMLILLIYKM